METRLCPRAERRIVTLTPMLFRLALALSLLSAVAARAQTVWQSSSNKSWITSGNWSSGVPNADSAIAQFGATAQPEINLTSTLTVDRIHFTSTAPAYTFFHKNGSTLTFAGTGIVNESAATQTFDVKANNAAAARIALTNSADAGNATFTLQGTATYAGQIDFLDTSSAGTAQLTLQKYGAVTFDHTASAANATITVQDTGSVATFQGSSTAASANIHVSAADATLVFTGNAKAGSATIDNTRLDFSGNASAENATFTLRGPAVFKDSSTAGNATINVTGGGGLTFSGQSSLGSASVILSNSAGVAFEGDATLGSGTISGIGNLHIKTDAPFVLSGEHTYSGTTKITGSELVVDGALPNTTMVEAFPATTLGGSGTIGGLVAIHPWAELEPGSDSVGTLTIAGGLLLTTSSIVNFQLGTQSDLIRLTGGTFSYAPGGGNPVTLNVSDSGGFHAGTYTLFDFTTGGVTLSEVGLSSFVLGNTIPGFDYTLGFEGNTLTLTALSPIPEPSTYAALGGLIALGFAVVARRRRLKPSCG